MPSKNQHHILIAEDSPTQAALLGFVLEDNDYRVTVTVNGQMALDAIKKDRPDLIVSDIVMPGMDGFALCQAVKSDPVLTGIPVILLSSLSDTQDVVNGLLAGADSFIRKADNEKHLLPRIRQLLDTVTTQTKSQKPLELVFQFQDQQHIVTSRFQQVFDLMISIYEQAIEMNRDLEESNRELELARHAAESASRTKSSFLANTSHELRTPLNAVIGYSELLIEELEFNDMEQNRSDVERILTAGKHLLSLINNVLDLAKIEAGRMEVFKEQVPVSKLLNEVVQTITPMLESRGNKLSVEIDPAVPESTETDRVKLLQILTNLLSNAAKFTTEGDVSLTVDLEKEEGNNWLIFKVTDSGIGMSDEQLSRMFDEFSQAEASITRDFGGTGLGLPISRKLARLLEGALKVESTAGEGSVFTLTLPHSSTGVAVKTDDKDEKHSPNGTVLLIVDSTVAADSLLQGPLEAAGWRVVTAHDAGSALQLAIRELPKTIILDTNLHLTDAWALLKDIKDNTATAHLPVVVCSTVGDDYGYAIEAVDHMIKPVNRKMLVQTLRKFKRQTASDLLIVDDDPDARDLLGRLARSEGWSTREASDGMACLDLLETQKPDAVLLDLIMPRLDGFGVIEAMKNNEHWQDVPVIIISAHDLSAADRQWMTNRIKQFAYQPLTDAGHLLDNIVTLVEKAGQRTSG